MLNVVELSVYSYNLKFCQLIGQPTKISEFIDFIINSFINYND